MDRVLGRRLRRLVVSIAAIVAVAACVPLVDARSDGTGIVDAPVPPTFAIAPSGEVEGAYFSATMEPGTEQTMTVSLVNAGEAVFSARTFAADAYTTVNGGMGVDEEGSEATGVTTWIDYSAETLILEPSSTIERSFTVTVPDDTPPGQYIAGIVLQTAAPLPISGSTTFNQILRKSVAVFITVPGPIQPGLSVGEVSLVPGDGWSALRVEVANTGNVLVRPAGTVVLRDGSGAAILTAPVAMGAVYAGHDTMLEIVIGDPLPPGDLAIEVELTDESHGLATTARGSVVVPAAATAGAPSPMGFERIAVAAMPAPDAIQYLDIGVRITNAGEPARSSRVILRVYRDGERVEDFPLATSLALLTGTTDVAQRYIPAEGWIAGAYTFALTLETVDPASGVAVVVDEAEVDGVVAVP